MNAWKFLTFVLVVVLGVSYVGFAYVYTNSLASVETPPTEPVGIQPKIVTLLKNSNVTSNWNASVGIFGYKTGFFYLNVTGLPENPTSNPILSWQFETDGIRAPRYLFGNLVRTGTSVTKVDLQGSNMTFYITSQGQWVVISMSLYLRD